jgi:hypothetical protein
MTAPIMKEFDKGENARKSGKMAKHQPGWKHSAPPSFSRATCIRHAAGTVPEQFSQQT